MVAPIYHGYWPWSYGSFGFGYYYGDSYGPYGYYPFGPWYGYGGYGPYPPAAYTYPGGSLRLKIKPRNGQVYVDGYFVGVVDEFDGIFQRLHLEAGPHRIEVRVPGFETLTIDVQIRWDATTTVEDELRRSP
ncbi:MAG TPA: PEGA domain-containing protein [Vicinamibacterales bacterium]|nr:PEGA domain-containing protein [Vicinamibacterales bacterium]